MDMTVGVERSKARLDQWLWFARFVKSRSLAARLCATGAVTVNGSPVKKANHTVRMGDIVVLPQGGWQRTVRVVALGIRRGPRCRPPSFLTARRANGCGSGSSCL